jgi:hypothetical protein
LSARACSPIRDMQGSLRRVPGGSCGKGARCSLRSPAAVGGVPDAGQGLRLCPDGSAATGSTTSPSADHSLAFAVVAVRAWRVRGVMAPTGVPIAMVFSVRVLLLASSLGVLPPCSGSISGRR